LCYNECRKIIQSCLTTKKRGMRRMQDMEKPRHKKVKSDGLAVFFKEVRCRIPEPVKPVAVCIGTDRSTGDSLGPLVGTFLLEAGYPAVIGSLEAPCDAGNLTQRLAGLEPGIPIVAIDACLGQPYSVGMFQVSCGPLLPGKSLGKPLPPVGDFSVAAIVNVSGPNPFAILQSTSLHRVIAMAKAITEVFLQAFAEV